MKDYSLVIIKRRDNAVNSSPKNTNGITALIGVSGRLNMKYIENNIFWTRNNMETKTSVVVNLDFTLKYLSK